MRIGIIVHSHTGHTLTVAQRLQHKLAAAGHVVTLERLETVEPLKPGAQTAQLKTRHTTGAYDALVLGCPVWGGRMSVVLQLFLEQITSLKGQKVACLVTHFFTHSWGADQTIRSIQMACEAKGATVRGSGNVRWSSLRRKREIDRAVDTLSRLF